MSPLVTQPHKFASPCWSLAAADSLQGSLSSGGGGSLLGAFRAAGWEPGPKAVVPATVAAKGASCTGDADDIRPTRHEGAALRADRKVPVLDPPRAGRVCRHRRYRWCGSPRGPSHPRPTFAEGSSGGGLPLVELVELKDWRRQECFKWSVHKVSRAGAASADLGTVRTHGRLL